MPNNFNPSYTLDGLDVTPSPIETYDPWEYMFWLRFLRQRYEGTLDRTYPEYWSKDQRRTYENAMFQNGYGVVFETPQYGVIFLPAIVGGSGGTNIFNMPRGITPIGNWVPNEELIIDENCKIIRCMPDVGYGGYGNSAFAVFGAYQICDYYAKKIARSFKAHDANILDSMVAYVFLCEEPEDAESFAKLFSQATAGNGAVFALKKLYDKDGHLNVSNFNNEVGKNYIADKLMADIEQLMCEFDSMVGIENTNTKIGNQGGISDMQIASNNGETMLLKDAWIKEEKESQEDAIKAYPVLEGLSTKAKKVNQGGDNNVNVERNA